MLDLRDAVDRLTTVAGRYRSRADAGTLSSQDRLDLACALMDAKARAAESGDPAAAFVIQCIAADITLEPTP